nr:hypothetical protein [Tanacetum cinerariifolium]
IDDEETVKGLRTADKRATLIRTVCKSQTITFIFGSGDGPFRCHAGLRSSGGNRQFHQGRCNAALEQDQRDPTGAAAGSAL